MQTTVDKEFVNRDEAIQIFTDALDWPRTYNVVILDGESGIGKSWLIERFASICRTRGFPFAYVDLSSRKNIDYLSVLTDIKYGAYESHFQDLRETIEACVRKYHQSTTIN